MAIELHFFLYEMHFYQKQRIFRYLLKQKKLNITIQIFFNYLKKNGLTFNLNINRKKT
jgi:hypothetical protein